MIQDIAPFQYKNEYRPVPPDRDSRILLYDGSRKVLVKQEAGKIIFPSFQEMEPYNSREKLYQDYTYLFTIGKTRFYLGNHISCEGLTGYAFEDTNIFRGAEPKHLGFAGITGWQLYRWYTSHQYCGRCGSPLKKDEKERMLYCPECHLMEYPKICPAVIVAVIHGNKLLLSKYAGREYSKYALIAGFAEVGETIEETVKREVMEEVGLKVKNITYYKSQPWSFSDTLLFGFSAQLDGKDKITIDREELAMAQWMEREEIPVEADDVSLTNEMMVAFKERRIL